ncbi:MAG: CPBP family intramembrane metalloprotease, partial [Methylobacteriaceae bacterium]|nr:CPBP family intramembrane metalloprotease [Methylobacteriaceae bacterium]
MAEANGSSEALKSNGNIGFPRGGVSGEWRETVVVLLMVLAPVPLTAIVLAAWISFLSVLRLIRGVPVEMPTPASIQQYGIVLYSVISWIDVAVVWGWSLRRGFLPDVFVFRRLTWLALTASIAAFVIAAYGAPLITHWLSQATSSRGPQIRLNNMPSFATYILCFVVTSPVCEEILYRGLLVAWLRRIGWRDAAILLLGSIIFGANHLIPFGLAWSGAMVVFGAMLFAMRLWQGSLVPGWLVHLLFNARFLIYPLL